MSTSNYPYPSYSWPYQGVDYAFAPTGFDQAYADQMYADGIRFVGRYLFPSGKGLTATEASYYLNAGISIFLYYEVGVNDSLGGYAKGYENGQAAYNLAVSLGVPAGTQVYCCCDTGVTNAQAQGVVMDYLRGFHDAMTGYNVGIYGALNVMEACYNAYPDLFRVQWGGLEQEFSPINIKQWSLSKNRQAMQDDLIGISNITIASNGYAYYRGHNVDLLSTPTLDFMWSDGFPAPPTPQPPPPIPPTPTPTPSNKMPIWMYLKPF